MAFSGASKFSESEHYFSTLSSLFTHPARSRILRKLIEAGNKGVPFNQITDDLPLHRNTISKHLEFLRKKKIIVSQNSGRTTMHYLHPQLGDSIYNITDMLFNISNFELMETLNDLSIEE